MVDELQTWPTTIRCFKGGSCHLTCDGDLAELHAFAERIGMKRAWFQPHSSAQRGGRGRIPPDPTVSDRKQR
jgi:hypothetical protein